MAGLLKTDAPLFSRFRGFILLLTFLIYACYHMSRKPISIVKVRLLGKEEYRACWAWETWMVLVAVGELSRQRLHS